MAAMWDDILQSHRPDDAIHSLRVPSSIPVDNATPSGEYDMHHLSPLVVAVASASAGTVGVLRSSQKMTEIDIEEDRVEGCHDT